MRQGGGVRAFPLVVSLMLAGCGAAPAANPTSPSQASGSPSSTASTSPAMLPIWSMTGLPGPADAWLRPVMMVKVENDPTVRPQTGLEHADMVFEELVEGGITRFATVYQSDIPPEIGPVRSIRHVDASLATPIADVFVFSGGAPRTMRFVERKLPAHITVVTLGGVGMHRTRRHPAPHNVFLSPRTLLATIAQTDTPTSGFFATADNATVGGQPGPMASEEGTPVPTASASPPAAEPVVPAQVAKVSVTFSYREKPNWTWNGRQWLRAEGKVRFTNPAGKQLGVDNLIVLYVRTIDAGYRDPIGNYVPRTVITGSGDGYLLSQGTGRAIHWYKEHVRDVMTLADDAGQVVTVPPGRTWVELVPLDGGAVTFTAKKAP